MSLAERLQKDFTTITLALIPVAIVINIVAGQIIFLLKVPVYLDSIGTVLVGALAGPLAGAVTGALTNLIWGILPPPIGNPPALPFSITAFVIGLLAGIFAQFGWFRRQLPMAQGIVAVLIVGGILFVLQILNNPNDLTAIGVSAKIVGGGLAALLTIVMVILVALRLFPPLVAVAGIVTGIVAAIVSAPISAVVYGGVTGGGTDALVALFQSAGASVYQAALGQGLTSDPFDKFVSFLAAWAVIRGLSKRLVSQFPRSENVMESNPIQESR